MVSLFSRGIALCFLSLQLAHNADGYGILIRDAADVKKTRVISNIINDE